MSDERTPATAPAERGQASTAGEAAAPARQLSVFSIAPNLVNIITLPPVLHSGILLEVEDATFNHDSAVMLPEDPTPDPLDQGDATPAQRRIGGLDVLRECLIFAQDNPGKKLLVAGHSDTTGLDSYNLKLSRQRAASVLHALLGEKDPWVKIAHEHHQVRDLQQILNWVFWLYGWPCFVAQLSPAMNAATKHAIEALQENYNRVFAANLAVDGKDSKETWGVIFDLYMDRLAGLLQTDASGLAQYRSGLQWVDPGRKFVGCGENWPIDNPAFGNPPPPPGARRRVDNYRSAANRRVEILFFDDGEAPPLDCHPSETSCLASRCHLYDGRRYDLQHLPVHIGHVTLRLGTLQLQASSGGTWPPLHADFQRVAAAGLSYRLTGAAGERTGTTSAGGVLSFWLAEEEQELELALEDPAIGRKWKLRLRVGQLNAPATQPGRRQRLRHLGYGPAVLAAWNEVHQTGAERLFRKDVGLQSADPEPLLALALGREHGDPADTPT